MGVVFFLTSDCCELCRRPHLVAAATNTGAVLLSFDASERPPVVALPAQVVTLEALLQQGEGKGGGGGGGAAAAAAAGEAKGAQGLTYVMASGGKLWSTALRMGSQRAEGAAERTVRCARGGGSGAASCSSRFKCRSSAVWWNVCSLAMPWNPAPL